MTLPHYQHKLTRVLCCIIVCTGASATVGQEKLGRENLHKPVFRVTSKLKSDPQLPVKNDVVVRAAAADAPHALDPAMEVANRALKIIDVNIRDYTCIMVKREQVNGQLQDHEYMFCKIRNEQADHGKVVIPFSVYLKFLKPSHVKGREVIYVSDRNNGKMTAHEGGFRGRFIPTMDLDPVGMVAMRGNRYPVTEIGIRTLAARLLEKGLRDRKIGPCAVTFRKKANLNDRPCTIITVKHDEPKPGLDFHIARVCIDDELQIPVRYEAYDWPRNIGDRPELLEEYTYMQMKVNVGLGDVDFDIKNPAYNF